MSKKDISTFFSSNPTKYYKVSLFDRLGFQRHKCGVCGKFFWSLVDKDICPDHETYNFIGNPPTSKRLDYVNAWKEVERYFQSHDHSIVMRYPVVCRWREDLYFTIASIVNFQRIMNNKVIFELPANPLVVPQMCLRFNDVENVGISGRHYTSFCMIGQTCNADAPGGYWKDKCIDLDFGLLTNVLGINQEEITFVEDVWMGAGAFGCSLEYFVRGLELGNAVFTEFEGNENNYKILKNKIIDMGAGLERFSWITMGTPTSYECSFGSVVQYLENMTGIQENKEILSTYFKLVSRKFNDIDNSRSDSMQKIKKLISTEMNLSLEKLERIVLPQEAIYTIADHTRTLLFAITDGSLPSNVGGGYNLRILLRRILSIIERFKWHIKIEELIDEHITYLKNMYPELGNNRDEVCTILKIESDRYRSTKQRMNEIALSIRNTNKELTVKDLIRLYESDGITPDFLKEVNAIDEIPSNFYTKLADLHDSTHRSIPVNVIEGLDGLKPTKLLYYEDSHSSDFSAVIIKLIKDKYVVLDRTLFYPRGGGQEPDTGTISTAKVVEVIKQGDIVIHKVEDLSSLKEGLTVRCKLNTVRRNAITKHHTATHILNSSARYNLGSWVWQNSAFKEETYGRLDITHHSALNKEQVEKIERTANETVMKDIPVTIKEYERGVSEQKFSFRIYQGGVVPSNKIRIVKIDDFDIEACGGTHVKRTGEIGLIKIVKSERIQDGVVRLEFVAGRSAIDYITNQDNKISFITESLGSSRDKITDSFKKYLDESEKSKTKMKTMLRKTSPLLAQYVSNHSKRISEDGVKLYSVFDEDLDDEFHITIGEKCIEIDPSLLYISLISVKDGIRVIVFAGADARKSGFNAGKIARFFSIILGGSGGGDTKFGQGGGKFKNKVQKVLKLAEIYVKETVKEQK